MCGGFFVDCRHRPLIFVKTDVRTAESYHRLDGKRHTRFKPRSPSSRKVIRDFGIFVHFPADAVSDHFSHNAVSETFGVRLHRDSDVRKSVSVLKGFDPLKETFFRYFDKFSDFFLYVSDKECPCRVSVKTVDNSPPRRYSQYRRL